MKSQPRIWLSYIAKWINIKFKKKNNYSSLENLDSSTELRNIACIILYVRMKFGYKISDLLHAKFELELNKRKL